MSLTDDDGVQHSTGRVQGIHGRVDAQLSKGSVKYGGSIQMGEGGSWGRISQIIGRDVDGLHTGDGALLSGGDSLL